MKAWAAMTATVTDDVCLNAEVVDVILRAEVRGNQQQPQPGQAWLTPPFSLFVNAGRVSLALGWDMFSALIRNMQARAWLGATHE